MVELQRTARHSDIHPALESHMLKMPQTIASLALLFEIVDGGLDSVGVPATTKAIKWAEYLLSHAWRLYSLTINQSLDSAKLILKRKDKIPNSFSIRDIQRKGWTGLDSNTAVKEALSWLIDYKHVTIQRLSTEGTNGRPKTLYHWVNPAGSGKNQHENQIEK